MEYSKEFKQAISNFSSLEKDRLIFRLLKKDKILSEKLYFELIDPETADEKRNHLENNIKDKFEKHYREVKNAKYFLMLIRGVSGDITHHVKVTSDKFGEIYLNLFLVNESLSQKNAYTNARFDDVYKVYIYCLNKIFKSLTLIKKIDEDYWMDFDEILEKILEKILSNNHLPRLCINNGLDFNWFKTENIPNDIADILRDIKNQGFLK